MTDEREAFPRLITEFPGMSLRDYFAAKAMQGDHANPDNNGDIEDIARWAYQQADAMMAERKKAQS